MIRYLHKAAHLKAALADSDYHQCDIDRVKHFMRRDGKALTVADEQAIQALIDRYDAIAPARIAAKQRVVEQAEQAMHAAVLSKYPRFEIETWSYQRADAERYSADNNAATPTLDRIAKQRGMDRVTLIKSVVRKVAAFSMLADTWAGERQRLEDLIDSMADVHQINTVRFTPPVIK